MLRISDIQDALFHVVGWQQSIYPTEHIDERLTESESGLCFQAAHPLLTLSNVASIMPDGWQFIYKEWNSVRPYVVGEKVRYHDIVWIAKKDNRGEEPRYADFNGDYSNDFAGSSWRAYNPTSDYLAQQTRNGIAQAIQQFAVDKALNRESKALLERRTFFDGAGRLTAALRNGGHIVGFEICPVRGLGVTTQIERVGLQMTGGTGTIRLYLFHSSQIDPIRTFDVEYTKTNGGFQWFNLKDCYLPYISDANDAGGCWYLCYNQNDLPAGMEAINVSKDWSREPCGTCNIGSLQAWRELTKYIQISPFRTHAYGTFKEYPEMWDVATMQYTNTLNYGLNVEVSVKCDLSDFIINQRETFANVIQKQVAYNLLRTMAMNPDVRVNRNQSNVNRNDILYELDGNTQGRAGGLGYELKQAYEALRIDTQGIDRICLTCNNGGVRYSHV